MKCSNANYSNSVSWKFVHPAGCKFNDGLFIYSYFFQMVCGKSVYDLGMNRIQFLPQLQLGPQKLLILTQHPPWGRGGNLNVEVQVQGSSSSAILTCGVTLAKSVSSKCLIYEMEVIWLWMEKGYVIDLTSSVTKCNHTEWSDEKFLTG